LFGKYQIISDKLDVLLGPCRYARR